MQPQVATNLGRATPERLALVADGGVQIDPTGRQRIVSAPLDRLLAQGFITQREFDNGDRLRADAYLAGIDPGAAGVDWNRAGGGSAGLVPSMFSAQYVADARVRYRRLKRVVGGVVWDVLNLAVIAERELVDVGLVIFKIRDQREAHVAAKCGLRVALGALADVYERGA